MAKHQPRPTLDAFRPTEPATPGAAQPDDLPATGRTIATGIGLKESEHAALKAIADENGIAVNAVARFSIRDFIKRYRRGEISLTDRIEEPPTPRKRIRYQ